MHLYLSQHGDALAKSEDADRPLSDKGRKDVSRMASFLARSRLPLAGVVHSGKLRAQQSALLYSEGLAAGRVVHDCAYPIAPNDPIEPLYKALLDQSDIEDNVMIVGHLPYMNRLVSRLVAGDETANCVQFEPGCVISLVSGIDQTSWVIQWVVRPSLLGS